MGHELQEPAEQECMKVQRQLQAIDLIVAAAHHDHRIVARPTVPQLNNAQDDSTTHTSHNFIVHNILSQHEDMEEHEEEEDEEAAEQRRIEERRKRLAEIKAKHQQQAAMTGAR